MDNASKAILMAGSVFIAIGVIGFAVYFFSQAGGIARQNDELMTSTQITSFNRYYTSYKSADGKVRVVDALNILNRAVEDGIDPNNIIVLDTDNIEQKVDTGAYGVKDDVSSKLINEVTYSYGLDVKGKVNSIKIGD